MALDIKIVRGPRVAQSLTKQAAEERLVKAPGFPKDAEYAIEEVGGYYIAAVVTAAPPFAPAEESAPPSESGPPVPPSEGESEEKPKEDKAEKKEGPPGEEGPPKPGEEKGGHLEHQVTQIFDMLTKMMDALGLSSPTDGMIPGADGGPMTPPPGPPVPPGGDTNPSVPGVQGRDNKTHTVHERALKSGEAPPGTTPVGAPAFASVAEDHPFREAISTGQKEFEVESEIFDAPVAEVAQELKELVEPHGYFVEQIQPRTVGGSRLASAKIVRSR